MLNKDGMLDCINTGLALKLVCGRMLKPVVVNFLKLRKRKRS